MAPGYAMAAIGFDYKPNEDFSLFISPATGKFTFVRNQILANAGAFGVEAAERNDLGQIVTLGKRFRAEIEGLLRFQYRKDIVENVTAQIKGQLESNQRHKDFQSFALPTELWHQFTGKLPLITKLDSAIASLEKGKY